MIVLGPNCNASLLKPEIKEKFYKIDTSADLIRSRPSEASSSGEEKAERSRCAPVWARAPPVSFGQPGNSPDENLDSKSRCASASSSLRSRRGWVRRVKS
jgi:hypothetical protein